MKTSHNIRLLSSSFSFKPSFSLKNVFYQTIENHTHKIIYIEPQTEKPNNRQPNNRKKTTKNMKTKNFCGIFATVFAIATVITLASCSQDDEI